MLERNPNWYGVAPSRSGARRARSIPPTGEPGDAERGLLDPAYVGRPLPFLDRVEFRLEKEDIPAFTKFLQGYYDASGIIEESFDRMVQEGALSPEMAALGMRLDEGGRCRRSTTSASTWTTRSSARRRASAAASCARR